MKSSNQKTESDQDKTFSTIDDALQLARRLEKCLTKLGEYKHPLDVRRGVRKMTIENEKESLTVKAGSRTYFFDVQKTREGKPYLTITESRYLGKDQERERNTITVFPEQMEEFSQTLVQLAGQVKVD